MARLSVVIVTYRSAASIGGTLRALLEQLGDDDELVVVDNASDDGTADTVAAAAPDALLVRNAENVGFAAAANLGATRAAGELLVFLNPDAVPQPGFVDAIRAPLAAERGWAVWMGLVTTQGGSRVNTDGGVVHFTGIAWSGNAGMPVAQTEAAPRKVGFASGACLAVPAERWRELGGFPASFFMYCEDVDLSLRARLAGGTVGIEPGARVDHDYDFAKGPLKWRLLERNRLATLVRTYPGGLLALVGPGLLLTELAIVAAAVAGGWARPKLAADADFVRALPSLLRERAAIQSRRQVASREFAAALVPELSSPYLGRAGGSPMVRALLRAYWRAVLALLRAASIWSARRRASSG